MRVIVHTIEDFIANLEGMPAEAVVEKTVWVDQTRKKISEAKFAVNLQASAVVNILDGQYLLQHGEDCGVDYEDASRDLMGTDEAAEKKEKLIEWCKGRGLMVRPGVVDF